MFISVVESSPQSITIVQNCCKGDAGFSNENGGDVITHNDVINSKIE